MQDNEFKERIKYTKEQQELNQKLMDLIDLYQTNNSYENREFLCYLSAAIFLTYKKLYPQLRIYIPFRTKSDISFIKNIKKEFPKSLENNEFDTSSIVNDISGIRIILDNLNFAIPPKGNTEDLLNDPEIAKLMKESNNDFIFIDNINEFLQSSIQNSQKYYELKRDLLKRIVEITPEEFTEERMPEISFKGLYNQTKYQYQYFSEEDSFPTEIPESDINSLKSLVNDFRSRIYDPLQFAILRKTLPVVFDSPLIKNVLKTNFSYSKETLKENGFHAIYYSLSTPFGPIEVQAQSNKAHYNSTRGSAFHSGIPGKSINVKDFFELVDEKDEKDISYYLNELDSFSADSLVSPYEIPEFETEEEKEKFLKTPEGIAYLKSEKYRELMKHIKIKQNMRIFPDSIPADVYTANGEVNKEKLQEYIDSGELSPDVKVDPISIDTDSYLFSLALSLSPYMNVCSSGHTSFTTAEIHHKKVIGEFSEILRKKDSNTCLRDLLVRRLEQIIENNLYKQDSAIDNPLMNSSIDLVKKHDRIANKLPKDISTKNIIQYGERLRNNILSNSDQSRTI